MKGSTNEVEREGDEEKEEDGEGREAAML